MSNRKEYIGEDLHYANTGYRIANRTKNDIFDLIEASGYKLVKYIRDEPNYIFVYENIYLIEVKYCKNAGGVFSFSTKINDENFTYPTLLGLFNKIELIKNNNIIKPGMKVNLYDYIQSNIELKNELIKLGNLPINNISFDKLKYNSTEFLFNIIKLPKYKFDEDYGIIYTCHNYISFVTIKMDYTKNTPIIEYENKDTEENIIFNNIEEYKNRLAGDIKKWEDINDKQFGIIWRNKEITSTGIIDPNESTIDREKRIAKIKEKKNNIELQRLLGGNQYKSDCYKILDWLDTNTTKVSMWSYEKYFEIKAYCGKKIKTKKCKVLFNFECDSFDNHSYDYFNLTVTYPFRFRTMLDEYFTLNEALADKNSIDILWKVKKVEYFQNKKYNETTLSMLKEYLINFEKDQLDFIKYKNGIL